MTAAASPIPDLPAARLPVDESYGTGALTWLGAGLDAALLGAMQLVVDATLMPDPDELPALRASAEAVSDPALRADPGRYFDFSDGSLALRVAREAVRRELADGVATSRELEGDYAPFAALPEGAVPDDRILLDHWTHEPEHRRGTVLCLHGFTMGQPRIGAMALMASRWWEAGLDVALLTLPYHGARTPAGARFSGEAFAVPHVARLAEAVRRAAWEVRALTRWLRETTHAPVGVLGLSLGGYLSALAAGLDPELDFAVPMAPPVCIGDLAWRFFRRSRRNPDAAETAFSYDELRASYRVHSPLAHPLVIDPKRVFIVAGRGDRIVPPEHPHALWRHWGEPGIHWFHGGHLSPFGRGAIGDAVLAHLRALAIL